MPRSHVAGVEAVEAETTYTFSRHTHETFGIGVIHRGAHRSASGRGQVQAGAGDIITVNPGEVHDGAPGDDRGRSWRIVYLNPGLVADAVSDMSQGKTGSYEFSNPVIGDRALARDASRLFTLAISADPGLRWEETLLTVLAAAMQSKRDAEEPSSAPAAVAKARDLIDDDPTAPVTLADLARESGISRFQVLRGFTRATGLTPHAYIVQRRIDRARRLIADRVPLASAALAAGFADQSHMTRVFVRKYGISPGAYAEAVA